jgi:hypothetical protein
VKINTIKSLKRRKFRIGNQVSDFGQNKTKLIKKRQNKKKCILQIFLASHYKKFISRQRRMHCVVLCCVVLWCGVVWCGVVWCGVVWCGVVWCGVVWCGVVWCGIQNDRETERQRETWKAKTIEPICVCQCCGDRTINFLSLHPFLVVRYVPKPTIKMAGYNKKTKTLFLNVVVFKKRKCCSFGALFGNSLSDPHRSQGSESLGTKKQRVQKRKES